MPLETPRIGALNVEETNLAQHKRGATQNPMANMDMAAFPGRTYRYLQVTPVVLRAHALVS